MDCTSSRYFGIRRLAASWLTEWTGLLVEKPVPSSGSPPSRPVPPPECAETSRRGCSVPAAPAGAPHAEGGVDGGGGAHAVGERGWRALIWIMLPRGHVPGQVLRGGGGDAGHAHGHDAGWGPRPVQDVAARAPVPRRRRRAGAVPPRDVCLESLGLLELGLAPRDVLPPMRPLGDDAGPIIR
jgi:hypothetical protein